MRWKGPHANHPASRSWHAHLGTLHSRLSRKRLRKFLLGTRIIIRIYRNDLNATSGSQSDKSSLFNGLMFWQIEMHCDGTQFHILRRVAEQDGYYWAAPGLILNDPTLRIVERVCFQETRTNKCQAGHIRKRRIIWKVSPWELRTASSSMRIYLQKPIFLASLESMAMITLISCLGFSLNVIPRCQLQKLTPVLYP